MARHGNVTRGYRVGDAEEEDKKMGPAERQLMKRAHKVRQAKMQHSMLQRPDDVSVLPVKDGYAKTKVRAMK